MPLTTAEIETLTDTSAQGLSEVEIDGRRIRDHKLSDRIEYEKWRAGQAAADASTPRLGIRVFTLTPPGAV